MRYFKAPVFAAFVVVLFMVAAPVGALAAEVLADITHPEATVGAGAVLDAAPAEAAVGGFASGVQALIGLAATVFLGFVGWIVAQLGGVLKKKFNIDIDEKTRSYLEDAIYNAILYAEKKALERAGGLSRPFGSNEKLAIAADYLFDHVPDALARFGLTREKVIRLIEARLGHIAPDSAGEEPEAEADQEDEEEAANV